MGLFGGSFDPPHVGHMAVVQAGLAMGLDEVWVIPALPVHRKLSGKTDGLTRFNWLQQLFEHEPRVKVLAWEISQSKPTPTVHSLRRFQAAYADCIPWLMLGADAWNDLPSWREYPAHQGLCNMLVFARQGDEYDKPKAHVGWQKLGVEAWASCGSAGHCCELPVHLPDVSATLIRQQAALGLSLTGLVPKVLQSEIEKKYT
ncbi:MAG: nicotinate (nicotinamide) nucleotide adenylyltransferase [Mariprofundus sp.]|nr:nicotinate (nicotinamide) nucleotide adenylyltransferase [Mariprofundus sp.]